MLGPPYINRVEKDKNYTVVDNGYIFDVRLSLKAKGLLTMMLSRPDDWMFYMDELQTHSADGEKSLRAGFKELQEHGYVKKFPVYENRKITKWVTVVYEVSQTLEPPVLAQKVEVQNVDVGFVDVQKEGLLSTDINQVLNKQSIDVPIINKLSTDEIKTDKLSTKKDRQTTSFKDSFHDPSITNSVDKEKEEKKKEKTVVGQSVHSSVDSNGLEKQSLNTRNRSEQIASIEKSIRFTFDTVDENVYKEISGWLMMYDYESIMKALQETAQLEETPTKLSSHILNMLNEWKKQSLKAMSG
ncbi:hypothetical protein P4645_10570 [Lysinibacillus fusiformis]|uniref:hypothetical protein n=1 Tax=Lysinibacillus fusiformis TaxID=28031 RepID=UPI0000F3742F|nr:hypothetical protein [Lysinibacillus fusiformis]EAZ84731.1 Phage replication protein [Bacillus sp. B14905]MED4076690.1 hypothetical protein [Lysinibacillus fusiformis]